METLVLPAQDQLACHQDGRSKRILRSSGMQPRSQGNSCASSSQCGHAHAGFPRNASSFEYGGRFQPDVSASGSFFVAKALAFSIFHPSSRSQSRGSATLPRQAAANCSVQEAHISSTGCANASFRSFSVPKGHGWRRSESAPRKALESEGMLNMSELPSGQPKPRKKCATEAKASGGTQFPRKSEGCSGSGRSSFERSSINTEETHNIKRTGSGTPSVKDDSKIVEVTPAVTILQRPKSKDAAMSNLARVLAGDGESSDVLKTVSTSVCQSVGGVFRDGTLRRESVSTKSSFSGHLDFHNTPIDTGVMPLNISGSKENSKLPLARSSPDAVMVCGSGRSMESVWRETVACIRPDRSGVTQPILVNEGKSLLSGDLKAMFTGSFLITNDVSTREDFSAPSSPPLSERWAGPAYSNSPPPSSLPFPTFSMRQLRTSLEILPAEVEFCEDAFGSGSLSAPATPSRCPAELSATAGVLGFSLDVVSATKDLRRILNLDGDI